MAHEQLVCAARFSGTLPRSDFTADFGRDYSTRCMVSAACIVVPRVLLVLHVTPACGAVVVEVAGLVLARRVTLETLAATLFVVLRRRIARCKFYILGAVMSRLIQASVEDENDKNIYSLR